MTDRKVYRILEGPCTQELIDGLRFGQDGRLVKFTVENDSTAAWTFKVQIVGLVTSHFGSCNEWFFKAIDEHRTLGGEYIEGHVGTDYIKKTFSDGVLQLRDQNENQYILDSIPDPIR